MALLFRMLFAAIFLFAGVTHFIHPGQFIRIVPPGFPRPDLLVAISGVFEILGGLGLVGGLLVPAVTPWAAWGLIALLIAVFPANLYMAVAGMRFGTAPLWASWARLPLQPLLIWWAWQYARG